MPPKRKARDEPLVKIEDSPSPVDTDSEEGGSFDRLGMLDVARELSQRRGEFNDDDVVDQASVFMTLPTDALLSMIVGVCSRLQAAVAPLSHKPSMVGHGPGGERRLQQDTLRLIVAARKKLTPAVNALMALEIALADAKKNQAALLNDL